MNLQDILNLANKINKIENHDYFTLLKTHGLTPEQFIKSQKNFGLAVNFWSILLGKLFIILPSYKERKLLVKNLNDENGDISHVESFNNYLKLVNNHFKLEPSNINPDYENAFPVSHFNLVLESMVDTQPWYYSALVFGMIEYTYITVSKIIHNYTIYNLQKSDIPHYSLHECLDMSHATDLFNIALNNNLTLEETNKALEYGYNLMNELYKGLLQYGLEK